MERQLERRPSRCSRSDDRVGRIDTNGLITWTIVTQTLQAFDTETAVDVRINADGLMTTGFGGADFLIRTAAGVVGFYTWDGSVFEPTSAPGLGATLGFPMTVTVQSSAIGSPRTVWFKLRAWGNAPYYEDCCADDAPAAPYWWGFDTSTPNAAPSTAPAPAPAPTPAPAPAPPLPAPTATPTASGTPPVPSFSPSFGAPHIDSQTQSTSSLLEADPVTSPAVRDTRIERKGKTLTITARFKSSIANAKVSCTINNGHTRLATVKGHADGKTATCRTTNREVRGRTIASMVLTLGGVTTRVKLALPAGALSAVK